MQSVKQGEAFRKAPCSTSTVNRLHMPGQFAYLPAPCVPIEAQPESGLRSPRSGASQKRFLALRRARAGEAQPESGLRMGRDAPGRAQRSCPRGGTPKAANDPRAGAWRALVPMIDAHF